MKFIYKSKEKVITKQMKEELETELETFKSKFKLFSDEDRLHVEIERLKNFTWKLKINWWMSKIGRQLIAINTEANFSKNINQSREKLNAQVEKMRIKR